MKKMGKLLRCPFCGTAGQLEERLNHLWVAGCLTPGCRGFVRAVDGGHVDPRLATEDWNRRR